MSVLNYIREQKRKLEERHSGETILYLADEEPISIIEVKEDGANSQYMRSASDILREIDNLRGLNVREREIAYADYRRKKYGKTIA